MRNGLCTAAPPLRIAGSVGTVRQEQVTSLPREGTTDFSVSHPLLPGRRTPGSPRSLVPKLGLGTHAGKFRFPAGAGGRPGCRTGSRASRFTFPSGAWERGDEGRGVSVSHPLPGLIPLFALPDWSRQIIL